MKRRKSKMKKKISLILALLTAASIMTGCKPTEEFPADISAANVSYEYEETYGFDETVILSDTVSVRDAAAKKTWSETELSDTMYVSKACSSRKTPSNSAEAVKKYTVGTKISVVAATDTGFYKLKDGSYISADCVTDEAPSKTTTAKKTTAPKTTTAKKTTTKKTTTANTSASIGQHPVSYTDRYPYKQLSKDEKTLYKNIMNAAYNFDLMADIPKNMSDESMKRVYKILTDNEAQIFWLASDMPSVVNNKLILAYSLSRAQAEEYKAAIDKKTATVMKSVNKCKTTVSKIKCIYDWVAKNNVYGNEGYSYNIINGIGGYGNLQCHGYAKTVQYLMDYAGLDCMVISGMNDDRSNNHAWNIVYCEDSYYAVDATWGDPIQTWGNKGYTKYVYFLANDDVMNKSHNDASWWCRKDGTKIVHLFDPPACTSTACSYYNVYNKKASGVKAAKQAIFDDIDAAIAENRNVVEIQVESLKTWKELTSGKVPAEIQKYAKSKSKNVERLSLQTKRAEDALVVQYDIVYKK